MVDLRREFDDIIDEFGKPYLLIRADKKQRCKCVDTLYNSARDDCPICLGTGYISSVEKVTGRDVVASIPETLPRMITMGDPANIVVPSRRFYFRHDTNPKRQDLIISCAWNGNVPVIDAYTEVYEVNHSEPKRADSGRVEYFIVSTAMDPINADVKLFNVTKNIKDISYYLTVRR